MAASALSTIGTQNDLASVLNSPAKHERCWYAAFTIANHEKRVSQQLGAREVEHFLPLYSSVRQWKDRRVELELPLFPGYVFVRISLRERLRVLQIPGVAQLVGFGGVSAALPEDEIEALRTSLAHGVRAEPHPFLRRGRHVRVKAGPLAGVEGILMRRRNRGRFVLSLEPIKRSVAIEVDVADLEPL